MVQEQSLILIGKMVSRARSVVVPRTQAKVMTLIVAISDKI